MMSVAERNCRDENHLLRHLLKIIFMVSHADEKDALRDSQSLVICHELARVIPELKREREEDLKSVV